MLASIFSSVHFDQTLITLGDHSITVGGLVAFVAVLLGTWLITIAIRKLVKIGARRSHAIQSGTLSSISRLLGYIVWTIGFVVALQFIGIDLSMVLAASAIIAVGLGFALQDLIQNLAAGITLLVENYVSTGDTLEVDGYIGIVQKIGIRSTLLSARDGEEIIIPNTDFVSKPIRNFTYTTDSARVCTTIGLAYGTNTREANDLLLKVAQRFHADKSQKPCVFLSQFAQSSIDFEVFIWTDDYFNVKQVLSDMNHAIVEALNEAKMVIAFPQLDVHMIAK